jgi:alkylation response protein AidB-like acyl-CoA dehydrogenase
MGYALYPGPYLGTVGFALATLGPEERAAVAAGTTKWSAEINGLVPWLGSVDKVVGRDGLAHDGGGEDVASVDPDRPVGRLEPGDGAPLPGSRDVPRARAAMAAEAVGIAQRVLELAIAHVSTREQFGRPIGVYQAVSHQLATTYTDVELARSLAYWAAWCVAEGDEMAPVAAAAAKAFAAEAAVVACERSIQVHGGTGFTWEHPLHRFYKRALWLHGTGSRPTALRAEIADAVIGAPVPA